MASATSSTLTISSSSSIIDAKVARQSSSASSQCVNLPSLPPPPVQSQNRPWKASTYCRKLARNVMAMASSATGEAPPAIITGQEISTEVVTAEPPEIVKKIQQAWDKVEDKYAVSTVAAAGVVALWGTAGMMSAIDRLPLIPGVLEVVGIGYTGWFAYKNLVFKPDREAFVRKVKETYYEIIGSSI